MIEVMLGAHDSNLLFRDRKVLRLSRQEQFGLLNAGLEAFRSTKSACVVLVFIPWRVQAPNLGDYLYRWQFICPTGGAISAMCVCSDSQFTTKSISREITFSAAGLGRKVAKTSVPSLGYLTECGTIKDIPWLREELGKNDYQTEKAAIAAILSIMEREGAEGLFPTLLELRPVSLDSKLLHAIFSKCKPPTEQLLQALDQRSAEIRQIAVVELRKRRALPSPTAEKLLDDESSQVRYEAMRLLMSAGRIFQRSRPNPSWYEIVVCGVPGWAHGVG
ncbi:MAG: hypothetical protein IPO57_02685 [Rhodocyclales bacterium]|nr:hypothetical protein [Rhodocyclales bacterium]